MLDEAPGSPPEEAPPGLALRDRLLALLLAEPTFFLVDVTGPIATLLSERGSQIALVACQEGAAPGELRALVRAALAASRAADVHVVAVGGGLAAARELEAGCPRSSMRRTFAVHQVDAAGGLRRLAGRSLSHLVVAAARLPAARPLTADQLASHLARGLERFGGRAALEPTATRFPWVTASIGALCVLLFDLGTAWKEWDFWSVLHRMGALDEERIRAGEVWRLLAYAFLHVHPPHLVLNMAALALFGTMLERLLGPRRYLLLYGLSALAAGLGSAFLRGGVAVGASGAICGLMAAAVAVLARSRGLIAPIRLYRWSSWTVAIFLLDLAYAAPETDRHAHLHGALAGAALVLTGLVTTGLPRWYEPHASGRRPWVGRRLAATGIAAAMAGSVAVALVVGHPWTGDPPPALETVALAGSGVTVAVPEQIARSVVEEQTVDSHRFTFGRPVVDPIMVDVDLLHGDEVLPADAMKVLESMRSSLQDLAPHGAERLGDAELVFVAGHPGAAVAYRAEQKTLYLWMLLVAGRQIGLAVYMASDPPPSWKGVESQIAESVATAADRR